jgi:outer membrane protein OmpA-like peptidoglycan-associated protein
MKIRSIGMTVAIIGTLVLTGCVTNPDPNINRTRTGAIAGGVIGALAGAARDDDRVEGALIGGLAGAALGGGIGALLDRQARELRNSLSDGRIQVQNTGSELVVTMPDGILFDVNSSTIRGSLYGDLQALARNLQQYPQSTINVIGHTDNTGSADYNYTLSRQRAQSVTSFLSRQGVSSSRLRSTGRGEDQPVATNLTPQGRQLNRRVEIIITPRN